MDIEKIRKQTKKNYKKWLRKKYRYLKTVTELAIENAHKNFCYVEFKQEYRFITWLIRKKLERKGFECFLIKDFGESFDDVLEIFW